MAEHKIQIEICCGGAEDALAARKGGADRVELNSCLFEGGLTPSLGALRRIRKEAPDFPVFCMVRPREGGFCYTETEFEVMLEDAAAFLECGADGIVFGFLKADGSVDEERCRRMLAVIGDKVSVFHRAIDVVPDVMQALDTLIELGVTRVLTSGQAAAAEAGADTIRAMITHAAGRIEVLPGAGIRAHNAKQILEYTGASMLHASARRAYRDSSCGGNPLIHFGGSFAAPDGRIFYLPEDQYKVTDPEAVAELVAAANG